MRRDTVFHLEPRRIQPEEPAAISRRRPSLYVRSQTVRRREERYELALLSVLSGLAVAAVVLGTATGAQFAWRLDAIRDIAQRILH
jgi:hypothetical protein